MAKMPSFGFQDALSLVMGKALVNSRRLCGRISQDLSAGVGADGQKNWMDFVGVSYSDMGNNGHLSVISTNKSPHV